ncbi:MAG: FecR family protein [bacterium]
MGEGKILVKKGVDEMYKKQIIFMVIFLSLLSSWVLAAKNLGVTITKVSGDCEVMRAGELGWIKANVDMRLYLNDRIRTKFISTATLKFDDGTIIDLEENTVVDIKELFESRWTNRTKSEMKIWIGEISGTIEKLKTGDSEFNIHTPVAIIGIRGTKVKVKVGSKGETTCYVHEGKAQMRGIKEPEDKWTTIKENEYATCMTGDKISTPEQFKPIPPKKEIPPEVKPVPPEEEIIPKEEKIPKPPIKPLPAPEIYAQFPEQNKPFINEIPHITVFISHPTIKELSQVPDCFLQIDDNRPIKLPSGVTKYRFSLYLKPGPNKVVIKAWYEKGQVAVTAIHFSFDPYPPIIRTKRYIACPPRGLIKEIREMTFHSPTLKEVPVEISVIVADLDSGIREVIVNGRKMEMEREEYYKILLPLLVVVEKMIPQIQKKEYEVNINKVEEVKLKVTDKADNVITEILEPIKIAREIKCKLEKELNANQVKPGKRRRR